MPHDNPNDQVTRADLERQLEVHAKTIELQILISQQQEKIFERLSSLEELKESVEQQERALEKLSFLEELKEAVETIERRTWKQGWLFWGLIGLLTSSIIGVLIDRLIS